MKDIRFAGLWSIMQSMLIRPATVRDVPAIAGLIATFAQRGKMLFRSHAELYEALRDFHVAELEGKIAGICGLEIVWADLAEVRSLAVDPAAQGKGIGTTLVRAVERELRDRGARMLLVETSSRPDYSNTRAFYAHCGYTEAARIRDFYAPADDRIMLTTRLTPERGAATR